jgi:methylase of polypeptide subunit release factors
LTAFDIGTGTGVIAAVLIRRGVSKVIATELNPRALRCAQDNFERLGLAEQVQLQAVDLFPQGLAELIVCNPPWIPAKATSLIEQAVYDPDSQMLKGFLNGLRAHLKPNGQAWLSMSDLAEHLGLRDEGWLEAEIRKNDLQVLEVLQCRPRHPKAHDPEDPLSMARSKEITSLWRLCHI